MKGLEFRLSSLGWVGREAGSLWPRGLGPGVKPKIPKAGQLEGFRVWGV